MARAQVDSHADDSVSLGGQVEPYFTAAPDLTHNHRQRRNRLAIPARNLISALPQVTQGESRVESAVRAQVAEQSLLAAAYLAQPCEIEMRVCIRRATRLATAHRSIIDRLWTHRQNMTLRCAHFGTGSSYGLPFPSVRHACVNVSLRTSARNAHLCRSALGEVFALDAGDLEVPLPSSCTTE